jgi:multimeric flavodoxin WrbA
VRYSFKGFNKEARKVEKVYILGISATPIKGGNCDKLVQEALNAAKELGNSKQGEVETEFVTLADKQIAMCRHCQWCIENRAPCKVQDDFHPVFDKMTKCDGLILGSPTWYNTLSPPLLNFFSRARYFAFFTHQLRNKVFGAITLGFLGFGMEHAVDTIKNVASGLYMVPVAEGWALSSTRAFGQRPAYLEHGVLDDTFGIMRVRMVGIRVVEVTRMIKFATGAGIVLPEEYKRTAIGGKVRPREEVVFVDGVWRSKG